MRYWIAVISLILLQASRVYAEDPLTSMERVEDESYKEAEMAQDLVDKIEDFGIRILTEMDSPKLDTEVNVPDDVTLKPLTYTR